MTILTPIFNTLRRFIGAEPSLVLCPFHTERTPSCAVRVDGFYCFGCGRSGTLKELQTAQDLLR